MIKPPVVTIGGSNPYQTGGELPAAHGPAHEHGGLDPITTVANIPGRLADLQKADTLQAVVVSATPPEAGQVLVATAADAAGWAAPPYSQIMLNDDETSTVPTVGPGLVFVTGGLVPEWAIVSVADDGTPTEILKSTNAALADTDEKLCVYAAAGELIVKNRLGSSVVVSVLQLTAPILS